MSALVKASVPLINTRGVPRITARDYRMAARADATESGVMLMARCGRDDRGHEWPLTEYALRGMHAPIGVADWETQLVASLPEALQGSLPTVKELEQELGDGLEGES